MSEKKKALLGCGGVFGGMGVFVAILIAAGDTGESEAKMTPPPSLTPAANASDPVAHERPQAQPTAKTIADATDEEQRFITQNTPDMKNAADAVGAMINLSGYLCSEVYYVEPTDGGKFFVDCIKHKGRDIKVRYLVDGSTGSARPL